MKIAPSRIDETTAVVVRALRHALERGRFSSDTAADVALVQLLRPGGPAKSIGDKRHLEEIVHKLARTIDTAEPAPRVLLAFARSCSEAAWALATTPRHPGARIDLAARESVRSLAKAALYAEATQSKDSEDHVRRAVTRALKERKRTRGVTRLPLEDGDPLRVLLDVPARGRVALPKQDVRARIAHAANGTALGGVLRQAARFAEEVVRPVIGEELWALCRPVGFADKAETRVLVEVRSAMVAHEVQLRSQELVHRLQLLTPFARLQGVKLVVVEPAARPVLS